MRDSINHRILIVSFLFFILSSGTPCLSMADGREAEKQLRFAEGLFSEGDYYRAISEYKRFIYYYPQDGQVEKAYFGIAESYYRAKRWKEAIRAVEVFLARYPKSSLGSDALWLQGMSEKNLRSFDESLTTFGRIIKGDLGETRNRATYQRALIYVEKEEWDRARSEFSNVEKGSLFYSPAGHWKKGLEGIEDLPGKSPAVAGTLAAVLPGAGHVYTERYRDALVAFLLNGAFIVAAVELFRHDNNVAGGMVTFFELGWYTGNIYSAVSSANKYNKALKEDYIKNIRNRSGLSYHYDQRTSATYVMYNIIY